ncbi:hypothetical protein KIN20_034563 [Parelaphostrongylus tenuis]|uniref:Uncharacterized protein n=1 Tax=Parelaphostrongylus tenuis TaxID=148309 RepID=A0AAD5WJU0_PARTN|nr:hypothetical protein KIN20_034563 [Parelaphostrongylus tenuis]
MPLCRRYLPYTALLGGRPPYGRSGSPGGGPACGGSDNLRDRGTTFTEGVDLQGILWNFSNLDYWSVAL